MLTYNSHLNELQPFGLTKNECSQERLMARGIKVFDFTVGDPKEATPKFIQDALTSNVAPVSQYPLALGSTLLRKSCAEWVKRRLNVELNPSQHIISSNGSKEAIFHAPLVYIDPNSQRNTVIIPEPGYPVYKSGTIMAGGKTHSIILNQDTCYQLDVNQIPEDVTKKTAAIWISYPHNPTGTSISLEKLKEIYMWCLEHHILLLSDECYIDLYQANHSPSHSCLQVAQDYHFKNLLCFFSLSKRSGMTGYRSGFIAGDPEVIAKYSQLRLNIGIGTPDFVQNAAIAAWKEDDHVAHRRSIFSQKYFLAESFFKKHHIPIYPSSVPFYLWGKSPEKFSSGKDFCDCVMEKTGILMTPGQAFGASCLQNFRMALVPTLEDMKSAFGIWENRIGEIL